MFYSQQNPHCAIPLLQLNRFSEMLKIFNTVFCILVTMERQNDVVKLPARSHHFSMLKHYFENVINKSSN